MSYRIGYGIDFHQLQEGRDFWIGGIKVPHHKGAVGHSDADVLLHAITDALIGALGLGDIGGHFPDTSVDFKNADSWLLLQHVAQLLPQYGYAVGNVDSTVIAQAPKLAGHIAAMRGRIAAALGVDAMQVNVKAKTAEKLGPVGAGQAMEAQAVILLYKV